MGEHDFSLTVTHSQPNVRRGREFSIFDNRYQEARADVAYSYQFGPEGGRHFSVGPEARLEAVATWGGEQNLGSRRQALAGLLGVFSRAGFGWGNITLSALLGAGPSWNYFDFGRGFPLNEERTVNGQLRVEGGLEFCPAHNFCLAGILNYTVERALSGPIDYQVDGFSVGLRSAYRSIPPPPPPPPPCPDCRDCPDPRITSGWRPDPGHSPISPGALSLPAGNEPLVVVIDLPQELAFLRIAYTFPNRTFTIGTRPDIGPDGHVTGRENHYFAAVASALRRHPEITLRVEGHANRTGPEPLNRILSLQRALDVRTYLTDRWGIAANRVLVEGRFIYRNGQVVDAEGLSAHGSHDPIVPEDPADLSNRCVTLQVLAPGGHL